MEWLTLAVSLACPLAMVLMTVSMRHGGDRARPSERELTHGRSDELR
jgi:hypothetical protein